VRLAGFSHREACHLNSHEKISFLFLQAAGAQYYRANPMSESYSHNPNTSADYLVVVSNEDDFHAAFHHFAEKVNRKLRAGYQLHGPPFNINHTLCQAMLRPEGAQLSGETTVFYKRDDASQLV
jgi:hypothetical protein